MQRVFLHPLPVRIWHWTNALGFLALIATGLQIRYVGLVNVTSFETAVSLHNTVAFVIIANFFVWLLFYLFSDKNRTYHPELNPAKYFRASFRQIRYYAYGMFIGEPNPHQASLYSKFNPLQVLTYQLVMFILFPLQILTGLLLWDIKRFSAAIELMGGVRVVDTLHVLVFAAFIFYMIVHAYLGAMGHTPSAHFKAMVTGYEDLDESHAPAP
jgi:Ni/Fe-hydrogenase b-type cytochrome subunit